MKTMTIAIRTTIVTIVLTGLIYPFAMTGLAQVLFRGGQTVAWLQTRKAKSSARS